MIVTIDGPAGAGKSTVARRLAERLGFEKLDTGATYRAVALALTRVGQTATADEDFLLAWLPTVQLSMTDGKIYLGSEEVTGLIRTPAISDLASRLSTRKPVRRFLSEWQRHYSRGRNLVSEGRDQGTVVFQDAACKFFLTANPLERARRRYDEMRARGESVTLEQVVQDQAERDKRDAERALAPLHPAADAHIIDTTGLTLEQVVATLEQFVHATRAPDRPKG